MKKISILIILVLLVGNSLQAGKTPISIFNQANELYSKKNYKEAIVLYDKIIKSGYHSAELYFNTGNAYYKSGNYPYAILFYEKAKLLDPSNPDIDFNLTKARTYAIDKIEVIPEFFISTWFENFVNRFPTNTWAVFGLIIFMSCMVLLSGYFIFVKHRLRKILLYLSIVLLISSVLSVTFAIQTRNYVHRPGTAIVVSPTISVKASPDYDAVDVFLLHEGSKVFVIRMLSNWYEIRLADGKQGWLEANSIEKI